MLSEKSSLVTESVKNNPFDSAVEGIGIFTFHLMLITASIRIINRFFNLPYSLFWVGEITRTGMVVLTLILVPYMFAHDMDISFLPIVENLPEQQLSKIIVVRNLLVIVLSVLMVWSSYLAYTVQYEITLPTVQWFYIRYIYATMGIGFSLLLVFVLIDLKRKLVFLYRYHGSSGEPDYGAEEETDV